MRPNEQVATAQMDPIYVPVSETSRLGGWSNVTTYRLIADEKLIAVKAGSKTLVEMASLRAYLASLPRFVGRTGKAA